MTLFRTIYSRTKNRSISKEKYRGKWKMVNFRGDRAGLYLILWVIASNFMLSGITTRKTEMVGFVFVSQDDKIHQCQADDGSITIFHTVKRNIFEINAQQ